MIGKPVLFNAFSMASAVAPFGLKPSRRNGQADRIAAIAPATCGAAIEVPDLHA